ncbi:MAG: folate-binding protein [Gammaproteobacteria bacterium]|nr:folate-binding protein [Gammaproteobacteria bacterium]
MAERTKPARTFAWLEYLGVLRARGRDARKFLHAQLTNDIAGADPGSVTLAAWCDPKGRMLALFKVAVLADDEVWLIAPAGVLDEVASPLSQFILRSRVKVDRVAARCIGVIGETDPSLPSPGRLTVLDAHIRLGIDEARVLIAGEPDILARVAQGYREEEVCTWQLMDVDTGYPEVWPATMGQFVPQMTNLDLIGGVSFSKGCYPGQEIVARTQYLGRIKRRMFRLQINATVPPKPGDAVENDAGVRIGTVVRAATQPKHKDPTDGIRALAVLRLDAVDGVIRMSTQRSAQAQLVPLPYT